VKTEILNVTGMTCGGCVASVKHALTALPGIANVVVSLPKKQVEVQFDESKVAVDAMGTALRSAGYDVVAARTKTQQSRGCCGA
jgi:copper ion binding protein